MKKRQKQSLFTRLLPDLAVLMRVSPLFLIAAGIAMVPVLLQNYQFETVLPVKAVQVEGHLYHLDPEQIKQKVFETLEGGYFTLNLERARAEVMKNAWVKDVSIRRQWPARLIVSVTEKQPVAYWNSHALISEEGDVFIPAVLDGSLLLPHMFGPEGQHKKVWMFMNDIYQPLAAMALQVEALHLDDRRAWKLELVNIASERANHSGDNKGKLLTVRLGRYQAMERFSRFVRVFSAANGPDLSRIQAIDMRYPNGFAVLPETPSNNSNKLTINVQLNIYRRNIYEKIIAMNIETKNIKIIKPFMHPVSELPDEICFHRSRKI